MPPDRRGDAPYDGEQIDLVVPQGPVGGYDVYARALDPVPGECLGATATTAAADPDDNRIQILNTVGVVAAQIAEADGVQYDLTEFSWLGRLSSPQNVLVVGNDSPIQTYLDLLDSSEQLRFVAQGPGANDYINPTILGAAYSISFEIITDFAAAPEARASVIACDADAHILPIDSQLDAIDAGHVRTIVTIDEEPDPLLPDAPSIYDTPPDDDAGQGIVDDLVALSQTGRGVAAPPGMDSERLTALREGVECATTDEALVASLEEQRPLDVLDDDETAALVEKVLGSREEFQTRVRDSF